MRNFLHRIPKPYLGFIALFFLVGATACEQLIQEGAREASEAGREIRDLENSELRPIKDKMESIQFEEIQPLQNEIDDLHREIERIQRLVIDPLWNNIQDPWSVGGELYQSQEALQRQYELIDLEVRQIEIESRELERRFRDAESSKTGFDPLVRQAEDKRYDLQRELDRIYRFGQQPIEDIWNQINTINSNPGGTFDSTQFETEQLNNKIADLYDQANWLQSDLDNRIREKEDLRNAVQSDLNNHINFGRRDIDPIYSEIARLEADLTNATVVTVSEPTGSSDEIDALRADRDVLLNALSADLAQIDINITAATDERDDIVASYQTTIDAKNAEIALLDPMIETDGTASSTPETTTTDNSEQIAALHADIDQVIIDRDAATATLDETLNSLRSERDTLSLDRQPAIDELNAQIFALQNAEVETVTTTAIPEGLTQELNSLRDKVAALEDAYTVELDKLQGLFSTLRNEVDVLYASGSAPIDKVYSDIEIVTGQINDINLQSQQNQLAQDDAVNALAAQAELLQQQVNVDIRYLEEQLFNLDDELQRLYRNSNDNNFDSQIVFNEAQRALEDRRYDLDDQRWLLDQQQQDLYSQNNDPYKEIELKAQRIYAAEIQPLQDRVIRLEGEIRDLWDQFNALEREMRLAERGIRDRERELEDKAFDFLDDLGGGSIGEDGVAIDGPDFNGIIDEVGSEIIDPLGDKLIDEVINPITDEMLDAAGDLIDQVEGLDIAPVVDDPATADEPVNADGTVDDTTDAPTDPALDADPVVETEGFDAAGNPIQTIQ